MRVWGCAHGFQHFLCWVAGAGLNAGVVESCCSATSSWPWLGRSRAVSGGYAILPPAGLARFGQGAFGVAD